MIETVNFEIKNKVLEMLTNGEAIRYGGIVRNKSGQILYHLRETNSFTENIGMINKFLPYTGDAVNLFSNITPGVNTLVNAYKVLQEHKTHKMLGEIKNQLMGMEQVLKQTQLFSAIGMGASLITLGVVVASFYVLNKKLNNITSTLNLINDQLTKMNQKIDLIDKKVDLLDNFLKDSIFAELKSSIEQLDENKYLSIKKEQREMLLVVKRDFKNSKFKFENVLEKIDPKKYETYDKFYKGLAISIFGEVQSSLYLNELDLAKEIIKNGAEMLNNFSNNFNSNDIINSNLNQLEKKLGGTLLISNNDFDKKKITIENTIKTEAGILKEIFERIDSIKYEVDTIEKNKITYNEWKNISTENNSNEGLILIKAK